MYALIASGHDLIVSPCLSAHRLMLLSVAMLHCEIEADVIVQQHMYYTRHVAITTHVLHPSRSNNNTCITCVTQQQQHMYYIRHVATTTHVLHLSRSNNKHVLHPSRSNNNTCITCVTQQQQHMYYMRHIATTKHVLHASRSKSHYVVPIHCPVTKRC